MSAGVPATFTVGSRRAPANIRDVTIDFGDGESQSLGAISGSTTIQHTYNEAGTYTVRATAIEASGFTETVVDVDHDPARSAAGGHHHGVEQQPERRRNRHLHRHGIGRDLDDPALRVELRRAGAVPPTAETTGNRATASYSCTGTKIITVRVIQATGPSGDGQTAITVRRGALR